MARPRRNLVIALASLAAFLAVLGCAGWMMFVGLSVDEGPTDRSTLLTVREAGVAKPDDFTETWTKARKLSGAVELKYKAAKSKAVFLHSIRFDYPSQLSAMNGYALSMKGAQAGFKVVAKEGVELHDTDELDRVGDARWSARMTAQGKPAGTIALVRQGTHVIMINASGLNWPPGALARLLEPKLQLIAQLP